MLPCMRDIELIALVGSFMFIFMTLSIMQHIYHKHENMIIILNGFIIALGLLQRFYGLD